MALNTNLHHCVKCLWPVAFTSMMSPLITGVTTNYAENTSNTLVQGDGED